MFVVVYIMGFGVLFINFLQKILMGFSSLFETGKKIDTLVNI